MAGLRGDTLSRDGQRRGDVGGGVSRWALEDSVTPGMYSLDDYDFRKPNAWLLQARQNPASPRPGQTEVFEWPGRFVEHAQERSTRACAEEEWQAAHRQISGEGRRCARRRGTPSRC